MKLSNTQAEKLIEISTPQDFQIFKILAFWSKSTKYTSQSSLNYLLDSYLKILSHSSEAISKNKQIEFENLHKIIINLINDIDLSSSLPMNVLAMTYPIKKKFEDIAIKLLSVNEDLEFSIFNKIWLKAIISIPQTEFLTVIAPELLKEKIALKLTQCSNFKDFDKKKEQKLIFSLIFIGKILNFLEEFPSSIEVLHEINILGLRLLKKFLKANKFGFKTLGLLNLIFATSGFLGSRTHDPKNLEKMDIPSLLKLLLESTMENFERQTLMKFRRLFEFLEEFVRDLKSDKTKLDLIEVFLNFYFKFQSFSTKIMNSKDFHNEKRDSFSKAASLQMIQGGESFRGIFREEDSKKTHKKFFEGFKDLILGLIMKSFELDIAHYQQVDVSSPFHNNISNNPGVNFLMVFSKHYLSKLALGEFNTNETTAASDKKESILQIPTNKTENFVVTEETNVFLFLQELLKKNESAEFRTFLFEMINSKLKIKMKGNGNSRQQNVISRLLLKFNVKAASLIKDLDTFRKVTFDLLNRYDEIEDEELKGYVINLARKSVKKNKDRPKVAFLLSQESTRFCKV